jgi:putative aldouronate transport system substrate-binding protein
MKSLRQSWHDKKACKKLLEEDRHEKKPESPVRHCPGHRHAGGFDWLRRRYSTTTTGTTKTPGSTTAAGTTAAATTKATEKIDTSPVTLSVFVNSPGEFKGMDATDVSKEVKKRTGVTLDMSYATTADSQELNTKIAAGALPDFVMYKTTDAVRTTLWKQGYVSPLNKLMDQYCPSMWDIMPTDFNIFWTESDKNFYLLPQYYCDPVKLAKIKGNSTIANGFVMHKATYEALGSPKIGTFEEYKALLLQVKEKYSDKFTFFAFDGRFGDPTREDMLNIINRMYGGTNYKAVAADGKVHLNFKDDAYKKAVLFVNDLYRARLFNPENFTVGDQFKEYAANKKIFSYWGQNIVLIEYDMENEATRPYASYEPPRATGVTPKFGSSAYGIGGGSGVSITTKSKNQARAIQYLKFLWSEEGQMLTYHGIEGMHYTMVDGMPKNNDLKNAAWANWSDMVNKLGIMGSTNWIPLMETDAKYYYWLNQSKPAYAELANIMEKYATNERYSLLAVLASDSEEKVIENKVLELWKNSLPKMVLATTQAECEAAYNAFLNEANGIGLAKLEAGYTAVVQGWMEKAKK